MALLTVLILRTWVIEGLVAPCQIVGGSMAPTLWGPHWQTTCAGCGYRFACGVESEPGQMVCPLCGRADRSSRPPPSPGDRLLVARSAFCFRQPRRWEVVAFRHPDSASQILVKRVVGLPGESIRIERGDVYADGEIARKTLRQFRAMAIPVHDTGHLSDGAERPDDDGHNAAHGWHGSGDDSLWNFSEGRYARRLEASGPAQDDWLVYRHPGHLTRGHGRVTDVYAYNQGRPRRVGELNDVDDLLVSLRLVETYGRGELAVRMTAGDGGASDTFEVRIDPRQNRYQVLRNGEPLADAAGPLPPHGSETSLEAALFDHQFALAMDGREVFGPIAYEPSKTPVPLLSRLARGLTSPPQLQIGSLGGLGAVVTDLQVFRDVYYTHPQGRVGSQPQEFHRELGAGEYFVLGDNSPISVDSRHWPAEATIEAKYLVGKPLAVHLPARRVQLGRWSFQVPDLARIRYIR